MDGWQPIRLSSESKPGLHYTVLVNPWREVEAYVCTCPGYVYRGSCKHQEIADDHICGWIDLTVESNDPNEDIYVPSAQTDQQHDQMLCPDCGGPTMWTVIVD